MVGLDKFNDSILLAISQCRKHWKADAMLVILPSLVGFLLSILAPGNKASGDKGCSEFEHRHGFPVKSRKALDDWGLQ